MYVFICTHTTTNVSTHTTVLLQDRGSRLCALLVLFPVKSKPVHVHILMVTDNRDSQGYACDICATSFMMHQDMKFQYENLYI